MLINIGILWRAKGKMHQPCEWFIAPYEIITQAIMLIGNGQIQHYKYVQNTQEIVVRC